MRFGSIALIAAQLGGCATASDVSRGTGATLAVLGAFALLASVPTCDFDDEELCADDQPPYDEDTAEERAVVAAGGGAAILLGAGLVAASTPPKKKNKRRAPVKPVAPRVAAPSPPPSKHSQSMHELIEKRGLEVHIPREPSELPRVQPFELSAPAQEPAAPDAAVVPGSGAR
jgi:hypothetical protein